MSIALTKVARGVSLSGLVFGLLAGCEYGSIDDLSDLDSAAAGAAKSRGTVLTGVVRAEGDIVQAADVLRLALVWYPNFDGVWEGLEPSAQCPSPTVSTTVNTPVVTRDVPLSGVLPLDFRIDIGKKPPNKALAPAIFGGGQIGTGHLVVYRDGNGNRRLDLSSPGAASPDEVVGASSYWRSSPFWSPINDTVSYELLYSDNDVSGLREGFTLLRIAVDSSGRDSGGEVPLTTPIEIVLRTNAKVQAMDCSEICLAGTSFVCPETPAGLPDGGESVCRPATEQFWAFYNWRKTSCTGCNCTEVECSYALDPNLPPPASWPCPLGQGTIAERVGTRSETVRRLP